MSCRYALDIAYALHHCHSNKILHLDVKPSNIMICSPQDYCKLCDFGSSHVLGEEEYCSVSPSMVSSWYLICQAVAWKSQTKLVFSLLYLHSSSVIMGKYLWMLSNIYTTKWKSLLILEVTFRTKSKMIFKMLCSNTQPKSLQIWTH